MFSGQLYEKQLSIRERNMKMSLKTVTYIAIKSHLHNYNRNCHVHNPVKKTTCITGTQTPICIITIKIVTHIFAGETATSINATERSTNIPVTESTTSKPE